MVSNFQKNGIKCGKFMFKYNINVQKKKRKNVFRMWKVKLRKLYVTDNTVNQKKRKSVGNMNTNKGKRFPVP